MYKRQVCPTCGFKLLGATQAMQPLVMSETPAATVEESAPARATLNVVRGPQVGISFVQMCIRDRGSSCLLASLSTTPWRRRAPWPPS